MRALIVDADARHVGELRTQLEACGYEVDTRHDVAGAMDILPAADVCIAFLSIDLPSESWPGLIRDPALGRAREIVLMSERDDQALVNRGIVAGATRFFVKPIDPGSVRQIAEDVASEVRVSSAGPASSTRTVEQFGLLRGSSTPMRELYRHIRKVAPLDTTVLVTGESGVGKELVAQTLHLLSPRNGSRLVALNCAAVPRDLFESELFGHEKGSFSGAVSEHRGFFERANGSTLLLDEITEMPIELQAKLLRALESKQVRRIGGEQSIPFDVRLIAATNLDPIDAIRQGRLRKDLYYRLARFQLTVPPLRDRGPDIRGLAVHFLGELNREHDMVKSMTEASLVAIENHKWPGNVRELRNALERAFILSGATIEASDFDVLRDGAPRPENVLAIPRGATIADAERAVILAAMEDAGGNKRRAAALGISIKTLYNRLHDYGEYGAADYLR